MADTFQLVRHEAETFDFKVGEGGPYSVPKYRCISLSEALALRGSSDNVEATAGMQAFFERHAPGCTEGLIIGDFGALVKAWVADSGMKPGESQASSA